VEGKRIGSEKINSMEQKLKENEGGQNMVDMENWDQTVSAKTTNRRSKIGDNCRKNLRHVILGTGNSRRFS